MGEFIVKISINTLVIKQNHNHNHTHSSLSKNALQQDKYRDSDSFIKQHLDKIITNLQKIPINLPIISGIILTVIGGVLWVVALSKYELSFLYPFLSINYTAIVIGSEILLKENVSLWRYLSIIFIIAGLYFISKSPYSEKQKDN